MNHSPSRRSAFSATVLKRFIAFMLAVSSWPGFAQQATIDITPGHSTNSFSPARTLGAGIDRDPLNSVRTIFGTTDVQQMLTAGWGSVSYRLNTELSLQAWHWNPKGTWSDPAGQGYFVGDANSSGSIQRSFGYNLPHRGTTSNYGSSGGYSRLDDGDLTTYWKSNPYLAQHYTGDADSLHPQWIVVDMGGKAGVNAIKLAWAAPYATTYQVQYWTGGNAIDDPGNGTWKNFPKGSVSNGTGGTVTLKLANQAVKVEYVRVLMAASSATCDTHGSADMRNCLGYAVNEVYLGTIDAQSNFTDLMQHEADGGQTLTYCSSVDPWHDPTGIASDDGEQPGFDLVFNSGLTRGIPMTVPVAMLYDNPDSAANEIAYLEKRGYAIKYVELGEEPDGQFVLPEDDAALYVQWANAIHAVDPNIKPSYANNWSLSGNTSWFQRFLAYLNLHSAIGDLNVMTFEHYPFDPCNVRWFDLYQEPQIVSHVMQGWRNDGLPPGVPMEITEANLAYDQATQYMQPFGALWAADFAGAFLTAGGQGLYYYQWEPLPMYHGCGGWGTFGMFNVDARYNVKQDTSQFFSAQLLNLEWVQPGDSLHAVYPASTDITDASGHVLVTVYSVLRPDGNWSLLLVNKDQFSAHSLTVDFHNAGDGSDHYFLGNVTQVSFGADNYVWHPNGQNGFANPDGPAVTSSEPGGKGVLYTLPTASVTVLRGVVQ